MRYMLIPLLLLLLTSCGEQPDLDALRMGLSSAPLNLDPRHATDAASSRVNRLLYRRLVGFDESDRPVPDLAHWQLLAPTLYRFELIEDGEGRRFSNGERLTTRDVEATLASVMDPATGSPYRSQLKDIERLAVLDEDRIDIFLHRPNPLFPALMALEVMPASLIAQGHEFHHSPVGSGPLVLQDWPESGRLLLRRLNDGRRVELLAVKDPGVRVMKLLRGEIDLLQNDLPPELFAYLGEREDLRLRRRDGANFTYIGLNLEDPVLSRPAVRQALAHAIDRGAIIRYVLDGAARPAEALLPPRHWAGAVDLPSLEFDRDRARALLRSAGFGPEYPLRLEYKTSADPFRVRLATIIQAQLAEVGIEVKVHSLDWGTFYGDVKAGRFQMYSLTWVGIKTPDHFRYVFHSGSLPPEGANRGRYRSTEADRLIEQAEAAPDLPGQARLYHRLQHHLLADLPYIPLWYEDQVVAFRRGVSGYEPVADGGWEGLATVERGGGDG